jgi:NitT/TauT family transport system substrate-binding protein
VRAAVASPAEATSSPSPPPQLLHTRAAYNAISSAHAPIWVTDEAGLFKKHGLDVDLQYVQGNNGYVALLAGEIDFLFANAHNFVSMAAEGAEIKVLACLQPMVVDYAIVTAPEIHEATDLRGKIIAVSGGSDLTRAYFNDYFSRYGMRQEDVVYITTGGQPERAGAVRGGAAQATMLNTPSNVALERDGFRRLANIEDLRLPTAARCISTRPSYLQEQPEVAERFVKAMIDTTQYMLSHQEEAKAIVRARLKIDDNELMDATYHTAANNVRDPVVPLDGLQASAEALADENPRTLQVDLAKMIDTSVLDRIRQSGFIDAVYRAGN